MAGNAMNWRETIKGVTPMVRIFILIFVFYSLIIDSSSAIAGNIRTGQKHNIPKYDISVSDEISKNKFVSFINKNRGKTVKIKILLMADSQYFKIDPRGTAYSDLDSITFWNHDCTNFEPPISCEGVSITINGNTHLLKKEGNGYLLTGTFKIGAKTELHQGLKCFTLSS